MPYPEIPPLTCPMRRHSCSPPPPSWAVRPLAAAARHALHAWCATCIACPCIGCGPRSMFVCCRTACLCRPLQPLLGELPLQGGRMGLGCMLRAMPWMRQCSAGVTWIHMNCFEPPEQKPAAPAPQSGETGHKSPPSRSRRCTTRSASPSARWLGTCCVRCSPARIPCLAGMLCHAGICRHGMLHAGNCGPSHGVRCNPPACCSMLSCEWMSSCLCGELHHATEHC